MKKGFVFIAAALFAFSACQQVEPQAQVNDEVVITLNAAIAPSEGPATRTVFVPEGGKVNWVAGDKVGAKYPGGTDNVQLTLKTGAGTTAATFEGTRSSSQAMPADPSLFVFYYPQVSGNGKGGTITDAENFVLENTFPKVQNSSDLLFEANWMYGVAAAVPATLQTTTKEEVKVDVTMKNVMAVLHFTVKGSGALKRMYVTDLDESAKSLYGAEKLVVENGAVKSLTLETAAKDEYDRTIISEFNKPIALTAEGADVYVTIFPRTFAKGLRVGFELENGDYMVKKLAENEGFTLVSNKVYTVPELTFASTAEAGKGYYDGVEYSFETFTDSRDNNVYKVATLKDGRMWMLENLRFVPDGITPSNSLTAVHNGVWYPVVINAAGKAMEFGDAAAVARFGYCYSFSTAMGQDADKCYRIQKEVVGGAPAAAALTVLKEWEGKQGICPAGWHVPTQVEYDALYKASGSSMSGLGAQGFLIKDFGYFAVANYSATSDPNKGTLQGFVSTKINMTYLLLSTPNSYTNIKAPMVNVTNNTAAIANLNILSGAPLRCIKDKE